MVEDEGKRRKGVAGIGEREVHPELEVSGDREGHGHGPGLAGGGPVLVAVGRVLPLRGSHPGDPAETVCVQYHCRSLRSQLDGGTRLWVSQVPRRLMS